MVVMDSPLSPDKNKRYIEIGHLGHIIEVLVPPTVLRVNIDLTQISSLRLSKHLFEIGTVAARRQWKNLDESLTVARDCHPHIRDIGIVLPRASQKHINLWTLAIEARLPKSIARSLCNVVSTAGQSTNLLYITLESNGRGLRWQNTLRPARRISIITKVWLCLSLTLQAGG